MPEPDDKLEHRRAHFLDKHAIAAHPALMGQRQHARGGFLHGLESRYGDVKDSLAGFTNDLSGSATGSLDLTATGSSSGSGSAGPAVVVNLDMKFGEREFGRLMVDALRKEVRARGGITAVFA